MLNPIQVEYNLQSAEYYFATLMDQLVDETMQLAPVDCGFIEQVNQLFYTIEAVRFLVDRGIFTENPTCLAVYNLMMTQIGINTTLPDLSVDSSLVIPGIDFPIPFQGPAGPQGPQGPQGPVYNPSAVTYTYTGVNPNFIFNLCAPQSVQIDSTVYDCGSVWVDNTFLNSSPSLTTSSLELSNLNGCTGQLRLSTINIQSLSLPVLKYIRNLTSDAPLLTSISLPQLLSANVLSFSSSLTNLTIPSLLSVNEQLTVSSNVNLQSISASQLKYSGTITIQNNASLLSINLQSLEQVTVRQTSPFGLKISNSPLVTSINISSLKYVYGFSIAGTAITTLNLSNLIGVDYEFDCFNNTSLTTITINPNLKFFPLPTVGVNCANCALNQTSIDEILVRLAALDGTNGTRIFENSLVTLTGGTNATPSATGLAAKAILVARGCTVTNN